MLLLLASLLALLLSRFGELHFFLFVMFSLLMLDDAGLTRREGMECLCNDRMLTISSYAPSLHILIYGPVATSPQQDDLVRRKWLGLCFHTPQAWRARYPVVGLLGYCRYPRLN